MKCRELARCKQTEWKINQSLFFDPSSVLFDSAPTAKSPFTPTFTRHEALLSLPVPQRLAWGSIRQAGMNLCRPNRGRALALSPREHRKPLTEEQPALLLGAYHDPGASTPTLIMLPSLLLPEDLKVFLRCCNSALQASILFTHARTTEYLKLKQPKNIFKNL